MKPTFDNDGYPTEETLETIKSWKIDSNKSISAAVATSFFTSQ